MFAVLFVCFFDLFILFRSGRSLSLHFLFITFTLPVFVVVAFVVIVFILVLVLYFFSWCD